jgi:thiol-disulfide isomerase/thioredoxin
MKTRSGSRRSNMRRSGGGSSNNNTASSLSLTSSSTITNIVILGGMIVVLVLIYYHIYNNNQQSTKSVESFTDNTIDLKDNDIVVGLFYADWCPHCVKFKPTWDDVITPALDGYVTKNKKNVRLMKIDCEKNKALANKYGIDGYPTIKVIMRDGGKEVTEDYKGDRDADSIKALLESM